ncbi:phenoloxidase-activating factor 2-like [Ctenocephalides felis]|uniref:phenoloxidase-activating factor 2-like n=1 Tax=Ctenocephalides felis TaxID=7515 RepID=UPI000E6E4640|nr:phenoloxidase-activating factor 2-like [Ctenocephalides felis]
MANLAVLSILAMLSTCLATGLIFRDNAPTNRSAPQSRARKVIPAKNKFNQKNSLQMLARQSTDDIRCGCVPQGTCVANSANTDGTGLIDFRIVTNTPVPPINPCLEGMQACCVSGPAPPCGQRYQVPQPAPTGPGQAQFGAYPWQAVLLLNNVYMGSGVLVDERHVITAAHKIEPYLDDFADIKVRLGEWDASSDREPIPHQEFAIESVAIHPDYNNGNLHNDIAVIRLKNNVLLGTSPLVAAACLPTRSFSNCNCKCWVSGWGKNAFTGQFQNVQKQVDVIIQSADGCQSSLRGTRLGAAFVFDSDSFICAGGEIGKDACTGDGGSPLSCEISGRWSIPGLVAWGIGCADAGVPGVYVNVLNFIPWIEQTIATPQ